MNKRIANYIINTLNTTVRPIESRSYARNLARRFNTSIFRIYGIYSALERSGNLRFTLKTPGGESFFR